VVGSREVGRAATASRHAAAVYGVASSAHSVARSAGYGMRVARVVGSPLRAICVRQLQSFACLRHCCRQRALPMVRVDRWKAARGGGRTHAMFFAATLLFTRCWLCCRSRIFAAIAAADFAAYAAALIVITDADFRFDEPMRFSCRRCHHFRFSSAYFIFIYISPELFFITPPLLMLFRCQADDFRAFR